MRIALIHYTYLPVIAGVELVMAEHARLFVEDGHTVTVIAGRAEAAGGETVVELPSLRADSPLAGRAHRELDLGGIGVVFEQAVAELVEELRPVLTAHDVVIVHNVATIHFHLALTAAIWRLAETLPAVRFISWVHDLAACNPDYAPLPLDREPWALLTRVHPRFTCIAVSELRRRQFCEVMAQPPERCRTIANGVEPTRLLNLSPATADLTRRFALLDREIVLLHPTRLLRRKNVECTLRVVAAFKAAGRSCAALVTGPPEVQSGRTAAYVEELRALRTSLALENEVLFLHDYGPLDYRAMGDLYRLANALFFPSRQEGFGLPLLEAALHRLPIFCSEIEPLRSLLPRGVTTFSLETPPAEIARLICRTLADTPAEAARRFTLNTCSWSTIYRNFLSPLLAEPNTP